MIHNKSFTELTEQMILSEFFTRYQRFPNPRNINIVCQFVGDDVSISVSHADGDFGITLTTPLVNLSWNAPINIIISAIIKFELDFIKVRSDSELSYECVETPTDTNLVWEHDKSRLVSRESNPELFDFQQHILNKFMGRKDER